MRIVPTFHRIAVKPISETELLRVELRNRGSALELPEVSQEKFMQGIVTEKGGGRILQNGAVCAIHLNIGDRVVFNRYSGTELSVDGTKYFVISEDDVICRLVNEQTGKPATDPVQTAERE